jgi:hypothetical protein
MSGARIFLGVSILIWLPYGLYCLMVPGALAESAGVLSTSQTGSTEIRAMYGGLQAAIGALALAGFLRANLSNAALLAIGFLSVGLFSARLLGLGLDGGLSTYTGGALAFEAVNSFFAIRFARFDDGVAVAR